MKVDETDVSIAGKGDVIAAGTARETRVSIGSGDVALTVEDEAPVSIMGRYRRLGALLGLAHGQRDVRSGDFRDEADGS